MPVVVIVEDGSGIENANSYQSVQDWKAYADQHGWDYSAFDDDQIGSSIIRATSAIDLLYESRFPGVQTYEAAQALQWPRKAGYVFNGVFYLGYPETVANAAGWPIPKNSVPDAIVKATAEGAWRELQSPGSLAPDLERGGAIKSIKAGSVGIEYRDTAPAGTIYTVLDGLMASLLGAAASQYSGRVVRV